ncbi:MAG: DUF2179 domain-containing protein [Phycisphaeraceae bacterium]|nr:DUF2179 domain-containing protein [Phycisphaerales bacterium]MCB9841753.1 DUF2179 domain-containing protein [Phycisphaeraceae bacterium]
MEIFLKCALIFAARVCDVSLGTIRVVSVVNGRRRLAVGLGFVEVLIWIFAVSTVVNDAMENPIFAVAYALGYATGSWAGITIERHLAFGRQVVRVFTRKGPETALLLREQGFRVTEFEGKGRDGAVSLLLLECERKRMSALTRTVREIDPTCFYIVDDVRSTSAPVGAYQPTGWRAVMKKK